MHYIKVNERICCDGSVVLRERDSVSFYGDETRMIEKKKTEK